LLPVHRRARPARAGRPGGLGARVTARLGRRPGSGQDAAGRGAVHDLLALPACRVGGAVRAARVQRPRAGDLLAAPLVTGRTSPMTTHEPARTAAAAAALSGRDGWQSVVADASSDQRAFKNVPWGKPVLW